MRPSRSIVHPCSVLIVIPIQRGEPGTGTQLSPSHRLEEGRDWVNTGGQSWQKLTKWQRRGRKIPLSGHHSRLMWFCYYLKKEVAMQRARQTVQLQHWTPQSFPPGTRRESELSCYCQAPSKLLFFWDKKTSFVRSLLDDFAFWWRCICPFVCCAMYIHVFLRHRFP